jgi:hypothetical protein
MGFTSLIPIRLLRDLFGSKFEGLVMGQPVFCDDFSIVSWLAMLTGASTASEILKIALVGGGSANPEWTSEVSNSTSFSGWSLADLWFPLSIQ